MRVVRRDGRNVLTIEGILTPGPHAEFPRTPEVPVRPRIGAAWLGYWAIVYADVARGSVVAESIRNETYWRARPAW